jgi:ABC-type phosphate transport system auxiliary subunit
MASKKDNANQSATEGNVGQIREILFGDHMRAFDQRFELVESRLAKETETLRKSTEKKIGDLERLADEIRDVAADQLAAETNNRDLALNKFELAMGSLRAEAESQMATIENRFAEEFKQMRSELNAMHKELSTALAKADRQQGQAADKLEEAKVARQDLAKLFRGLAESIHPEKTGRGK